MYETDTLSVTKSCYERACNWTRSGSTEKGSRNPPLFFVLAAGVPADGESGLGDGKWAGETRDVLKSHLSVG